MKKKLKKYRRDLGLTQTQFSKILGFSRKETVCEYETGLREIPLFLQKMIEDNVNPVTRARVEFYKFYAGLIEQLLVLEKSNFNDEFNEHDKELIKFMYEIIGNCNIYKNITSNNKHW